MLFSLLLEFLRNLSFAPKTFSKVAIHNYPPKEHFNIPIPLTVMHRSQWWFSFQNQQNPMDSSFSTEFKPKSFHIMALLPSGKRCHELLIKLIYTPVYKAVGVLCSSHPSTPDNFDTVARLGANWKQRILRHQLNSAKLCENPNQCPHQHNSSVNVWQQLAGQSPHAGDARLAIACAPHHKMGTEGEGYCAGHVGEGQEEQRTRSYQTGFTRSPAQTIGFLAVRGSVSINQQPPSRIFTKTQFKCPNLHFVC